MNSKRPRLLAFVFTLATAALVSWATPDGNLVVTTVPALTVGLVVYGLALWRVRRRESPSRKRLK